jgi:hypothetical protein
LERRDDDRLACFERCREFFRLRTILSGDGVNDAGLVIEFVDRVPELFVQYCPVGNDYDPVEDCLVVGVVERNKSVNKPRDGFALPASGGVLNKVILTGPVLSRTIDQFADAFELVISRED